MKRNSKLETRNSKETRNPRLEIISDGSLEFWTWGDAEPDALMALREDGRPANPPPQDLEERTARFGEAVIRFVKRLPQNPVNSRLISQLAGAGTSVGANFCEASDSVSGKDFKKSIGTCRKESKESMFFLRMSAVAEPELAEEARELWREAKQLNLIFGAIWRKP
jgi:four helix bundle protein